MLRPGGVLFVAMPSLDSWSARLMRERWMEFKAEHLFYFDSRTMQSLLFKAGFEQVEIERPQDGSARLRHSALRAVPGADYVARGAVHPDRAARPAPPPLVTVVASGINVLGRRAALPPPGRAAGAISVVMPVFNER